MGNNWVRFYFITIIFFLSIPVIISAEAMLENYQYPKDKKVLENLEKWQDLKFGLMMHWGTYTQWGIVESWSLCNEKWIERRNGRYHYYGKYKEDYENLKATFNPVDFAPDKWAKAAKNAGMKYLVFTTKHHDGFCMFDTKTTDYKITSEDCPFHNNPKANVTKEIFDSFRKTDFMIGAYFSKPDWYCDDYWWPYYATPDRHVNYKPQKHPKKWQAYKDYTYHQIKEIMTGYGNVDVLWLDGAWVRPYDNIPEKYESWGKKGDYHQSINIPRIAKMARKHQPGLIIVDRWVSGKYENYLTPENKVPGKAIKYPWESCIPMAPGWSYNKNHKYKSVHRLVHLLVNVVAKGGNLLVNIGPSPQGDWAPEAYQRLEGIGKWMDINSQAIYGSEPIAPYSENKIRYTRKNNDLYGIYLAEEDEKTIPEKIMFYSFSPQKDRKVVLLGYDRELKWEKVGPGFLVHIPPKIAQNPACQNAWTIKIENIFEK